MITYALVGDEAATATCAAYLAQLDQVRPTRLTALDQLRDTNELQVLVLLGDVALAEDKVAPLTQFVQSGGSLVCTGAVLRHDDNRAALTRLAGRLDGSWTAPTELIARTSNVVHPLTQRFEPRWPLVDALFRAEQLPADATPLLEVAWQMRRYPVAYARAVGAGYVVVTTLGTSANALQDEHVCEFIGRAVMYAGGRHATQPVNIAMIGFGAIGREHGDAIAAVPGLEFTAVCDRNPQRLEAACAQYPALRGYSDMEQVLADDAIDLVIVSTPPNTHAAVARDLLRAGKHVVVEKPFCLTTAEADELIATAQAQRRTLTVYQNRRWDADFLAIKAVVHGGAIGDVFHLETFIGGYGHPCDYWHSDAVISGGVFYDWGSHYLDWIVNLIPEPVVRVSATEHKRVWHDVTNADHSTIRLQFANGAEAEFVHSDIAAALKPKWYVLGTRGAVVAAWRHETVKSRRWSGDLVEQRLQAAESPARVTVLQHDLGDRVHTQELALPTPPLHAFHRNLADHLLLGLPLAVRPDSSRRNIAIMEAATRSAKAGGAWVIPA